MVKVLGCPEIPVKIVSLGGRPGAPLCTNETSEVKPGDKERFRWAPACWGHSLSLPCGDPERAPQVGPGGLLGGDDTSKDSGACQPACGNLWTQGRPKPPLLPYLAHPANTHTHPWLVPWPEQAVVTLPLATKLTPTDEVLHQEGSRGRVWASVSETNPWHSGRWERRGGWAINLSHWKHKATLESWVKTLNGRTRKV